MLTDLPQIVLKVTPEAHLFWPTTLIWQSNYEVAMEQNRRVSELDPESAEWSIGWTDIQVGNFRQALPRLQKAYATDSTGAATAGYLGYAYATSGDRARAMVIIAELRQQSSRRFVSPL
jgi:predicted Zn-dependent protease